MKLTSLFILVTSLSLIACKKHAANTGLSLIEKTITVSGHNIDTYSTNRNAKYLVVFESGLGDDHAVWPKKCLDAIAQQADVLTYSRAGYGKSESGPAPRNIATLSAGLEKVIEQFSGNRKVILIGHSLGGMIVRDYAIKHPSKTAAILFVDPSHEHYNRPSVADQEMIYNYFAKATGSKSGGAQEAKSLIEDSEYTATLPALPNVPVIVLTSMKTDADHATADRKKWFDAHEMLGTSLSDFQHIAVTNAGHYIMTDAPEILISNFNTLLSKLR